MAKAVVGSMSDWSGVLKDFFRQIADGSHTLESVQAFNEHSLVPEVFDMSAAIMDWQTFYRRFFDMDVDFSGVRIPERQPGFGYLIIIAKGLTPNMAYRACERNFKCWRYAENLNLQITHNDRVPHDHYAIWVRARREADEELQDLSAYQIEESRIDTETLTERLIHELKFWDKTRRHLDVGRIICLCSGSRIRYGLVPDVCWRRDSMIVGRPGQDEFAGYLRARQVVS
jgi:hypothetical protein